MQLNLLTKFQNKKSAPRNRLFIEGVPFGRNWRLISPQTRPNWSTFLSGPSSLNYRVMTKIKPRKRSVFVIVSAISSYVLKPTFIITKHKMSCQQLCNLKFIKKTQFKLC